MSDVEALSADGDVPVFAFAEEAARALGHAARYREWRDRPTGTVPELADAPTHARPAAILGGAATRGSRWLGAAEVADVLACYDLPSSRSA